ncbi:MAG: acyloxyacyl hydrolase [Leptolyngbya sp. SIO3F4]|nr:acyloxyacyl hydrolase [Leptolyngbya sp. SIO3F4]
MAKVRFRKRQMERIRNWCWVFLGVVPYLATGQVSSYSQGVEVLGHYGFIIAHRQNIDHVIKGHTPGLEVNYEVKLRGKQPWQHCYGFPTYGASYLYFDLGNPEELGYGHGILAFFRFPLWQNRTSRFDLKLASGLGYITKRWERLENHNNILIGSHFNMAVQFQASYRWQFQPRWAFRSGIGLTHFSNGASVIPNLGINLMTVSAGLTYEFGKAPVPALDTNVFSYEDGWGLLTSVAGFFKEAVDEGGDRYAAGTWLLEGYRDVSTRSRFSLGVSTMYNGSLEKVYAAEEDLFTDRWTDWLQVGIQFGYHLKMNRWELYLQNGVYVYSLRYPNGILFSRLGGRYRVNREWFLTANLKSHLLKADYFEFGFGRYLWRQ